MAGRNEQILPERCRRRTINFGSSVVHVRRASSTQRRGDYDDDRIVSNDPRKRAGGASHADRTEYDADGTADFPTQEQTPRLTRRARKARIIQRGMPQPLNTRTSQARPIRSKALD